MSKEVKDQLVIETLAILFNNYYDNKQEIQELVKDALQKKSIGELKKMNK